MTGSRPELAPTLLSAAPAMIPSSRTPVSRQACRTPATWCWAITGRSCSAASRPARSTATTLTGLAMPTVREVQEIAVSAASGSFVLQRQGDASRSATINRADPLLAVQAALETLYGGAGIQVERQLNLYRVTFGGTLAG